MKRFCFLLLCLSVMWLPMSASTAQEDFCIAKDGKAATIFVDENDFKGVIRAANNLGDDVRKDDLFENVD